MSTHTLSVFRKDKTNVGDWWSPPHRYFPLNVLRSVDLVASQDLPNEEGVVIVGGGGLGNAAFKPHLDRLTRKDRKYTLVAWGVGADVEVDRKGVIHRPQGFDHLLDFFSDFDEVGTRIFPQDGFGARENFRWVPCASCMSSLFRDLADVKPTARVGYYLHKRVPLDPVGASVPDVLGALPFIRRLTGATSNRGANLLKKLRYLAGFEFIVTNSYHGVYWATLLGRKAICQPFKDGLYSFRHAPAYLVDGDLDAAIERAVAYPHALEECREANIDFYRYLTGKYGDV